MDKNAIKKYAVWARNELIARVSQKAQQYGITAEGYGDKNADSVNGVLLSATEKKQRQALIAKIDAEGFEQVMEEVAYTWFNRFTALRFMEVNNYLPSHTRVFTNEANEFKPQILADAISLELEGLDMDKVFELKNANKDEELYKYLLTVQCNALSGVLPGMFQHIEDYTELLLPDYLLREGSVIEQMITLIPEEDWTEQVQIIGWLYQYYNSEPKDQVFSKKGKFTKEEIPAATQLFTPDWIVRYMVENSLGQYWMNSTNRSNNDSWKYLISSSGCFEGKAIDPSDIKCIDPCAGSGHILCYMFDVLVHIYEEYGYGLREAVEKIVNNNLWGLDIDERAAQLSYFSIMMKARQYDRRFFSRKDENGILSIPQPHVYAMKDSNGITSAPLHDMGINLETNDYDVAVKQIMELIQEFHDAKEYGSMLNVKSKNWELLRKFAVPREPEDGQQVLDIHGEQEASRRLQVLINIGEILSQKYEVVCTNPPYMKADNMPAKLADFVLNYKESAKYDLYAAFIYRCHELLAVQGYMAMITMHNFMFAPSFLEMRDEIKNWNWVSMAHLGSRAFSEISGEVVQTAAYVISKNTQRKPMIVIDVTDEKIPENKEVCFLKKINDGYKFDLMDIDAIPGHAFGYALSSKVISLYAKGQILDSYGVSKAGVVTGADDYFVNYWYEVDYRDITFNPVARTLYKYVLFSKGGTFFKWYGNAQNVLKLEDMYDDTKTNKSVRRGDIDYYYKKGIGWSQMGGGVNKAFSVIENAICKTTTPMMYVNDIKKFNYVIGFLNSKIPPVILKSLNPTLSILTSDIMNLPFVYDEKYVDEINMLVEENICLAESLYEQQEEHWQFRKHPLIGAGRIVDLVEQWKQEVNSKYTVILNNEKRLNEIYAEILGLRDSYDWDSETINEFDESDAIKSLISFSVGCMFGRYSLDVEGIAFAGGEWTGKNYTTYCPDVDGIIPICDDEYFTDDIVALFVDFIKRVYGDAYLDENLKYIAQILGGKGSAKEVIRNYFISSFFSDHCKRYQKAPIYWLFDSGKKNGFKCLIYVHRYQSDTIARIRTDYVHEQQSRYRTAIAELEQRQFSASTSERVKLDKKMKLLREQAEELRTYEEKVHHLADQMVEINLDAGIKNNYSIFSDVLSKI